MAHSTHLDIPPEGQHSPAAQAADSVYAAETRVRLRSTTPEGSATLLAAAGGSLGLVWLLYERVLPTSGVLGFWLCWYLVFLALYYVMARMQRDKLTARDKLATVAFGTSGVIAFLIVLEQVGYTLLRGAGAVHHLNFWTQSMSFAGPASPMSVGGVLHAIVGSLEELAMASALSVPLGVAAALFLSEVGGALARAVRTIVEAMTALPDLIAGLFIYASLILTLGLTKSGFCASMAIGSSLTLPLVATTGKFSSCSSR